MVPVIEVIIATDVVVFAQSLDVDPGATIRGRGLGGGDPRGGTEVYIEGAILDQGRRDGIQLEPEGAAGLWGIQLHPATASCHLNVFHLLELREVVCAIVNASLPQAPGNGGQGKRHEDQHGDEHGKAYDDHDQGNIVFRGLLCHGDSVSRKAAYVGGGHYPGRLQLPVNGCYLGLGNEQEMVNVNKKWGFQLAVAFLFAASIAFFAASACLMLGSFLSVLSRRESKKQTNTPSTSE